ncbi:MAG: endonuclease/exonuclease/phosphatase family protein [Deltaproteobacteria bacterium]|nr:MAG: endonuclease/exonuclease/phosphatase family protein [Deltaproteobacteria bacterium]
MGHQVRRRAVAERLLDDIANLGCDLFFLTEYVDTREYRSALEARWRHTLCSPQIEYRRGYFNNQVIALSGSRPFPRPALLPVPDTCALAGFLSVEWNGLVITGLRAPYYKGKDWTRYWAALRERLDGDVAIGDLNIDPSRNQPRDRQRLEGWSLVTPEGGPSYLNRGSKEGSNIDHALIRGAVRVVRAEYRTEFFEHHNLDHCPIVIDIERQRQ